MWGVSQCLTGVRLTDDGESEAGGGGSMLISKKASRQQVAMRFSHTLTWTLGNWYHDNTSYNKQLAFPAFRMQ
jgi:hypothetical protein